MPTCVQVESYDVVVMESRFIPLLVQDGLLAELHRENLPNLKNISANFRELAYDPKKITAFPIIGAPPGWSFAVTCGGTGDALG